MNKIFFLLMACAIGAGCNSSKNAMVNTSPNTLTQKEKNEGWKLLFNGTSTTGWHSYGKTYAGNEWKVEDGVLHLDGSTKNPEHGDLVTNEEYENFDLKLEWKISKEGNSGIIFYVHEDPSKYPDTYNTGPEMQVLDNGTPIRHGQPDGKFYTHRAGDLYDMMASTEVARPLGEWNQAEIKSVNGKLDFYMNGVHTLSTSLWDKHWQEMIAISKFREMPGFGTFKKGRIALQDHGDDIWVRNIRIKAL
jgi:hypothetical protein